MGNTVDRRRARRRDDARGRPHHRLRARPRRPRRRGRGRGNARPDRRKEPKSLTGQISGSGELADRRAREHAGLAANKSLRIVGARHNNLRNVDVDIPLESLVCVTGVSGSGKSSLVNDILVEALQPRSEQAESASRATHDRIEGLEHLDKLIAIDQSPIGRTPRSNPATYIKLFDEIRDLYTQLPESKTRGYKAGPVQLQRRRRPLRSVRGERLEPAGDGFSGRRLGHLPRLRRPPLQLARRCKSASRASDRRRAGNGRAAGARALRKHSQDPHKLLHTLHDVGSRLPQARPAVAHAFGRRGAADQAGPRTGAKRAPAARSICSTSRRPACTLPTSSMLLEGAARTLSTPATRWSWSSTIST